MLQVQRGAAPPRGAFCGVHCPPSAAFKFGGQGVRKLTQLRANYRSHQDILALPSRLFYQSQLLAASDEKTLELPNGLMGELNLNEGVRISNPSPVSFDL